MNRLSSLGFESWDLGGAGDCFFRCFDPTVGMTVPELRRRVAQLAQHMRDKEPIYGSLGDFEIYGGYQAYWVHVEYMWKAMLKSLPPLTLFRGIS